MVWKQYIVFWMQDTAVKKKKLNYRFHNPNTVEATADILLKVFIEVNSKKVGIAVQEATEQFPEDRGCEVGHSA